MSAQDKTINKQEEEEDVPELQNVDEEGAAADVDPAQLQAMMENMMGAGKQPKKYAKAMQKMGLKPEPNVLNVKILKHSAMSFSINKPEVYRFPGTDTFVMFGDAQVEESNSAAQKAAAAAVTMPAAEPASKKEEAEEDETEEDAGDIADKEIDIVMSQAGVSRNKAIKALKNNKGDIVNTIMERTM